MKEARSMFIFSVLLIMSLQELHFQNDQKNGALYLHGKLGMQARQDRLESLPTLSL